MSKITLAPDVSGSGTFTIAAPDSSTDRTLTLPDNSGTVQTELTNGFGFRNRLINGNMVIDQRNAGASVATSSGSSVYTLDRWQAAWTATSKFTIQRSTVAPAGFTNSLLVTSSAATSVSATDYYIVSQNIEGFNIADMGFGTANALPVTLSFWVRSSLTGTFGGALNNGSFNRGYPFTFTISAANTWEYKTVTVVGDTTGTWSTDSNGGMYVMFGLGAGASVSGTAGAWAASGYRSATGAVSVVGTSGATFYITGVQLEAGSVATPFERRPYGTELQLCYRYFYTSGSANYGYVSYSTAGTTNQYILANFEFPVAMRATPTLTGYYNGVSGKLGYMYSNASFGATAANIYGILASNEKYGQINLYGISCYGIRGDYTASAEL